MPSRALVSYGTLARGELDEVERTYLTAGITGAGRRQVARAYVVLVASSFQRFCRELHGECIDHMAAEPLLGAFGAVVRRRLTEGRKLDAGNPTPGNIGSDFGRFGIAFWDDVRRARPGNAGRQQLLDALMRWRNAFAHQDFANAALQGRSGVRLSEIRVWRRACDVLAADFDGVMRSYLRALTGMAPW